MQLLFEFDQKMGEDMMLVNWRHVCCTILKDINADSNVTQAEEKKVLTTVTRNIFHRKPSVLPVTFVEVGTKMYIMDSIKLYGCNNYILGWVQESFPNFV